MKDADLPVVVMGGVEVGAPRTVVDAALVRLLAEVGESVVVRTALVVVSMEDKDDGATVSSTCGSAFAKVLSRSPWRIRRVIIFTHMSKSRRVVGKSKP